MQQSNQKQIDFDFILGVLLRRRWLVLVPFVLSVIAGICYAVIAPKTYSAETLILVEPQRVPQSYVTPLVSADIETRLSTIRQQILSRTNIEKIISDFKLFNRPEEQGMYFEEKIESLRKRITIDVTNTRKGGSDAFTIAFEGQNPETVMKIVNALANYFIDENLKARETQALGTSDFLQDELGNTRKKLEAVEEKLKTFREENMGELPEQLDSNLKILTRLQEQLNDRQQSIRDEKDRLAIIENQLSDYEQSGIAPVSVKDQRLKDLKQLRADLSRLTAQYTENHPDIIRTRQAIAEKEKELKAAPPESGPASANDIGSIGDMDRKAILDRQKESILQLRSMTEETEQLKQQIELYQQRVENTPKREQQLISLNRDHANIQESYNSLLARRLEAELAVNMERKQKGEQFRIVDHARLPEKPIKPDMRKIFMVFCGAGLALGAGIAFGLEYLKNNYASPEEINADLDLPVLATIPPIFNQKDYSSRRWNNIGSIACAAVSFVLLAFFTILTIRGVDETIALIHTITSRYLS